MIAIIHAHSARSPPLAEPLARQAGVPYHWFAAHPALEEAAIGASAMLLAHMHPAKTGTLWGIESRAWKQHASLQLRAGARCEGARHSSAFAGTAPPGDTGGDVSVCVPPAKKTRGACAGGAAAAAAADAAHCGIVDWRVVYGTSSPVKAAWHRDKGLVVRVTPVMLDSTGLKTIAHMIPSSISVPPPRTYDGELGSGQWAVRLARSPATRQMQLQRNQRQDTNMHRVYWATLKTCAKVRGRWQLRAP